jgi:hypothetical protein
MKKLISFLLALNSISLSYGQSNIVIQRGANTLFETSLDSAIIKAQQGDVIYLSSGIYVLNATITKKVSIIGTGYHPDSTAATGITAISNSVTFNGGSDSSFITGVLLLNTLQIYSNNVFVTRCNIEAIALFSNTKVAIQECIVHGLLSGSNSLLLNCSITNCILFGELANVVGGLTIGNNIFLRDGGGLPGIVNCLLINNIFYKNNPFSGSANLVANNNLFEADSASTIGIGVFANNVFNESSSSIFMNYPGGASSWSPNYNFHLKPGCNGIGLGLSGSDVGIYGGSSPWKEGGKPFNPHFQRINIANGTGTNGSLNIDIKVEAQDR